MLLVVWLFVVPGTVALVLLVAGAVSRSKLRQRHFEDPQEKMLKLKSARLVMWTGAAILALPLLLFLIPALVHVATN